MRISMKLTIPADGRLLPSTRQAIAGYLDALHLDEEQTHDVILAIDEACTNVIRHAFPGGPEPDHDRMSLTAELAQHSVCVTVEDEGVGVDESRVPGDVIDLDATSGRGLQIIRSLMTTVELESGKGGGTKLTMCKLLSAHPAVAHARGDAGDSTSRDGAVRR